MPDPTFDKRTRRYTKPDGSPVTPAEQRQIVLSITGKASDKLQKLTNSLIDGDITTAHWAVEMKEQVRNLHSSLGQLAHGGKSQMGPKQLGGMGAAIRDQNKYLNAFINEVENGLTLDGTVRARAGMYADAGWVTYERGIAMREKAAGMTEERSVLEEGAAHCDGCLVEAARDWVPIGELIPVGDRDCQAGDRCSFEYR